MNEAVRSIPPGRTEHVLAERALVLAPHFDDEIVGCGGLIAQLVRDGARVTVVFLTDGRGGVEGPPRDATAADYAARRKAEAIQVGELQGVEQVYLAFADGTLVQHREALQSAIEDAVLDYLPDLLLVPSPLELTSDHRTAFCALHAVFSRLRDSAPVASVWSNMRVLAYEVNHPLYPDLLVDVSDQLEDLEQAMTLYASQQERHDYLSAAMGLRRYRCHTLPPAVRGAEGYRRLDPADFTTRSLESLVAHLGGAPSAIETRAAPTVSVIVRTRDRPELLKQALDSLAATGYPKLQVVLVNDGGVPPKLPVDLPFSLERVDLEASLGRAGAANTGLEIATGAWVGFLDDDDIVFPEHLATLAGAACAAGARVVYSDAAVGLYRVSAGQSPSGEGGGWVNVDRRVPYSRDFDPEVLLLDNYIPFNTLLVERTLAREVGGFDTAFELFEDWDFLIRLSQRSAFHHLARVTCEYRHFEGAGHHILGARGETGRFAETKARVVEKHWSTLSPAKIAAVVARLRREAVQLGESQNSLRAEYNARSSAQLELVARLRRDIEGLREELTGQSAERERLAQRTFDLEADRSAIEKRLHAQQGELVYFKADRARREAELDVELARLYQREESLVAEMATLHSGFEDRGRHLERTFAEIERLNAEVRTANGLVARMEGTRAWRWHQRVQRLLRRGERPAE